jgi:hypothetical protein
MHAEVIRDVEQFLYRAMIANLSERTQEEVWGKNPNTLAAAR